MAPAFTGSGASVTPTAILADGFTVVLALAVLGVVGEYVGRIYEEVKARPHYVIEKVVRKQ